MITKSYIKLSVLLLSLSILITACLKLGSSKSPSDIDFSKLPLKSLSEYGLLKGTLKNLEPNESVLEYEPIAPLFTDYAHKSRFVWMPNGSSAKVDPSDHNGTFLFPDKSILVKNFYYPEDFNKPDGEKRIVETRLLIKEGNNWKAYPYVWNDDQTEAIYKVTGGIKDVHYSDAGGQKHSIKYAIPNKNQCKSCHNQNDKFEPIGPKVKQLNNELVYADGTKENQLAHWQKMGYLEKFELNDSFSKLVSIEDSKSSVTEKARSYLDSNCGYCHNKKGPGSTSGLYLNYEEKDPFHWGVLKSPVAAGIGAGSHKYAILPGHADQSIIPFRMNSTNPGIMMPEIGRVTIHKEGLEIINKWINEMP